MLSSAAVLSANVAGGEIQGTWRTFDELAAVDLAGCDLERDDVALGGISTCAGQRPGFDVQLPRSGA